MSLPLVLVAVVVLLVGLVLWLALLAWARRELEKGPLPYEDDDQGTASRPGYPPTGPPDRAPAEDDDHGGDPP